jgi:hypothetical protein
MAAVKMMFGQVSKLVDRIGNDVIANARKASKLTTITARSKAEISLDGEFAADKDGTISFVGEVSTVAPVAGAPVSAEVSGGTEKEFHGESAGKLKVTYTVEAECLATNG